MSKINCVTVRLVSVEETLQYRHVLNENLVQSLVVDWAEG